MHSEVFLALSDHYELPYEEIDKKADEVVAIFKQASQLDTQQKAQDFFTNAGLTDDKPLLFFQLAFQLVANMTNE